MADPAPAANLDRELGEIERRIDALERNRDAIRIHLAAVSRPA